MTPGAAANRVSVRKRWVAAIGAALCFALAAQTSTAQPEWQFSGAERIVAVADIHGAYQAFEEILKRAEVIDESLGWIGGDTHLVIVGDVTDRGPDSRIAFDLIRSLEGPALEAGGRVHLVLGNHEIMNMMGDLRYVSPDEYAAFADEEPIEIREAEFARFVDRTNSSDEAEARAEFDAAFPLGFFAHREAYSLSGEYGSWLVEKPVLLVVNDIAFIHGGFTDAMTEEGSRLNEELLSELREFLSIHATAVDAGIVSRTVSVYDLPLEVADYLERNDSDLSARLDDAGQDVESLLALEPGTLFSPDGPLWYRGNVGCNRLTEQDRLTDALDSVGASHLVVGHTPTERAVVLSRMERTLLRIDTGMLNEYYGGRASALIVEGGEMSVLYQDETERSEPIEQPRRVGQRAANASEEELESLLVLAEIGRRQQFDRSAIALTLIYGDHTFLGLFTPVRNENVNPAVAAYRLDRLLGLDMVPVTVERELDGIEGALQFLPDLSYSESDRSEQGLGASAWCPLSDQFKDMYLFDALIFNEARTLDRIRYSSDRFQVLLLGHDYTFSTDRERPEYLETVPVELTPAWKAALNALDEEALTETLGDVLDRRRIRALLARRDHLIELAE